MSFPRTTQLKLEAFECLTSSAREWCCFSHQRACCSVRPSSERKVVECRRTSLGCDHEAGLPTSRLALRFREYRCLKRSQFNPGVGEFHPVQGMFGREEVEVKDRGARNRGTTH